MKVQIRSNAFETNSSSSHSLVLAGGGTLLEQPFSDAIVESGVLTVSAGEYAGGGEVLNSPYEKLCYLYTSIQYGSPDRYTLLQKAVKEHTGLELVGTGHGEDNGYIDHQSTDVPDIVWNFGIDGIKQFLFNKNSKAFIEYNG